MFRPLLLSLLLAFVGCQSDSTIEVVSVTGQIHDAVVQLTQGTPIESVALCGPGVDPHSYQASAGDVAKMVGAKCVIRNGLHLEAKLDKLLIDGGRFADKTWTMADAFPADARIDWVEDGEVDPDSPYDPHIWNNLSGWAECVRALGGHLGEVFPEHAETIRENASAYVAKIDEAHRWAGELFREVPEERRFLVSGHDAFNYFASAYGLETIAVLGIGNEPELDIASIREVSTWVCERKVPVVFMETVANPKIAEALQEACSARGWQVRIADKRLYSDDLGAAAPEDTYLGAFESNVRTVHAALTF